MANISGSSFSFSGWILKTFFSDYVHKSELDAQRDFQSKYDKLLDKHSFAIYQADREYDKLIRKYDSLVDTHNRLVRAYNEIKGKSPEVSTGLTSDDIKKLVILCHPDKHGNKQIATDMTAKLLKLRT